VCSLPAMTQRCSRRVVPSDVELHASRRLRRATGVRCRRAGQGDADEDRYQPLQRRAMPSVPQDSDSAERRCDRHEVGHHAGSRGSRGSLAGNQRKVNDVCEPGPEYAKDHKRRHWHERPMDGFVVHARIPQMM
jgi:hypothetical protein